MGREEDITRAGHDSLPDVAEPHSWSAGHVRCGRPENDRDQTRDGPSPNHRTAKVVKNAEPFPLQPMWHPDAAAQSGIFWNHYMMR